MKRISRLLLAFAMLFVMVLTTACGSKGENATKTFVLERNGIKITLVYTYIESEDKVIKQTSNTIAPYSGFNGLSKEEVKIRIEAAAKQYPGIHGLKESVTFNEDGFTEELEVDYENLDFEKARQLPGMIFSGDPSANKVSMKASEEMLLQQGFEEK